VVFYDHTPKLINVEEQQVNEEVITIDIEVDLAANEREPRAKLAERIDDALDEPVLQLSLDGVPVDGEELERERILRDLLSELRVGTFESMREVGRGRALTEEKVGPDLVRQHGSAPTLCDVLSAIPVAQLGVVELLDQLDDMAPGQLANGSLTDCVWDGPRLGEPPHVLEVGRRESFRAGELCTQIHGELGQDLAAPRGCLLSLDDRRSDLPVQPEQFGVDPTLGDVARLMHKPFDALERGGVVGGDERAHSIALMEAADRLVVAGCSADGAWSQGLLESANPIRDAPI